VYVKSNQLPVTVQVYGPQVIAPYVLVDQGGLIPASTVNVRVFGAKCDGSTDDTKALQAAAASLQPLTFPPTTCMISGQIVLNQSISYAGIRGASVIKAKSGFSGASMIQIGNGAPNHQLQGSLSGIRLDCNSAAPVAVIYGGSLPTAVYDFETEGDEFFGCTSDGVQIGANSFILSFDTNVFWGNGRNGMTLLGGLTIYGENINLRGNHFSSNAGNGLTIGNQGFDRSAHNIHSQGNSYNYNTGWQVQCGTSATAELEFTSVGDHVEAPAKWMLIEPGCWAVSSGSDYYNGGLSGGLGYLIDNEGVLVLLGGRAQNSGGGSILKASESGVTSCQQFVEVCLYPQFFGPPCSASNIRLGSGWGIGASAGAVRGGGPKCEFTIISGSAGFAEAPTVTYKFPATVGPTFTGNPICSLDVHAVTGAGGFIIFSNTTPSVTAPIFTATTATGAAFTPAASETYTVIASCGP